MKTEPMAATAILESLGGLRLLVQGRDLSERDQLAQVVLYADKLAKYPADTPTTACSAIL